MIRAAILFAVIVASASAFAQPPQGPTTEKAKGHQAAGIAAYKAKDFATASKEFAAGYAAERYPGFLFSWAQSDRQRGECTSAVEQYQRFLDTAPPPDFAQLARDGIAACGGANVTKPPPEDPTPVTPVMPVITADDKLEVPERPPPRDTPFPHKLSIVLLATGAAFGGSSAFFYVSARNAADDADRAAAHTDVVLLHQRSQDRLLLSRISLAVGLGFVTAGAIRFALTDSPPDDTVAFGLTPAGELFVAGSF